MQWPHAPVHKLEDAGTYIVTGATYQKRHHLAADWRRQAILQHLFSLTEHFGWELHAWAVMSNHYHFIAGSRTPDTLPALLNTLHTDSANAFNEADQAPGRMVWYQYWETHLTYRKSYLARMKYVIQNPVHHGIVENSQDYRWCSASWFHREFDPTFRKTVESFKIDSLNVRDDF